MKQTVTEIIDYYVHERLQQWARWHTKCMQNGLGYPPLSVEGRLQRDGGVLPKSTAPLHLPSNPDAEEVDELMNALGQYDMTLAEAIKIQYLERDTLHYAAKLRKIPLPTLKNNLRLAKVWLAGRLQSSAKKL